MYHNVIGWDPSLTSSGYSYKDGNEYCIGRVRPNKRRGVERLLYIREHFEELTEGCDLIVYEGYSMGTPKKAQGGVGRFFSIGELGGVLLTNASDNGIPVLLVPPMTLKMFATGMGNAPKEDVIAAVKDYWGYDVPNNDEADAFALMKLGQAYKNNRMLRCYDPKRRRAFDGCQYLKPYPEGVTNG